MVTHEAAAWEKAKDFSTGCFTPVREEIHFTPCDIEGVLPPELNGIYIRNGPNPVIPPKRGESYHYFDGDGMLAAVEMQRGKARFCHKWVKTERYLDDLSKGRSVYEFGSLAMGKPVTDGSIFNKEGYRMGKANTSVMYHAQKLLALEEADLPYHVALPSLDTVGKDNFNGTLDNVFTAHPKVDPDTQEMVGYGYNLLPGVWNYTLVDAGGRIQSTFPIKLRNSSYNHDTAMTARYSIVFDGNLVMDFRKMMKGDPLWTFREDIPGRIGILPRHATDATALRWFDVKPFCVSHTVNAYDDGDDVVIVANLIGDEKFLPNFSEEVPEDPRANLHQWRLNVVTGYVKEDTLYHVRSDFPTINNHFAGRPFRYAYIQLVDYDEQAHFPMLVGCYKYDMQTRTPHVMMWGDGCLGGEVTFVPRPNPTAEDDGYAVVYVNDVNKQRTELRVYDAQKWGEPPVATVIATHRIIPMGTHGLWVSADDIQRSKARL